MTANADAAKLIDAVDNGEVTRASVDWEKLLRELYAEQQIATQGDLGASLLKASALKYDSQRQTQKPCEKHPDGERWGFEDEHIGDINWHCWPCLLDRFSTVPAGDLAQWREEAERLIAIVAHRISAGEPFSAAGNLKQLLAHLAAMPAQADPTHEHEAWIKHSHPPAQDVSAELLGAAKAAGSAVNDYAVVCPIYEREVIGAIRDRLSAAIEQAEREAAG